MKRYFTLLVAVLLLVTLSGCIDTYSPSPGGSGDPNGRIEGYVYASGSELLVCGVSASPSGYTALQGALVTLEGTSLTATTDASGRFQILSVPPATYTLAIAKDDYSYTKEITVTAGTATIPNQGNPASLTGYLWRVDYSTPEYDLWRAFVIHDSPTTPPEVPDALPGHEEYTRSSLVLHTGSISIRCGDRQGATDGTGYFSITGLTSGLQTLNVPSNNEAEPVGIILLDGMNRKPLRVLFQSIVNEELSFGNITF